MPRKRNHNRDTTILSMSGGGSAASATASAAVEDPADYGIMCAIDGTLPAGDALILDDPEDDVTPLGWLKITVEQRMMNPEYTTTLQSREVMIAGELQQAETAAAQQGTSAEELEYARRFIRSRWNALYSHAVSTIPRFVIDEEIAYVRLDKKQCREAWAILAKTLGLEVGTNDAADDAPAVTVTPKAP